MSYPPYIAHLLWDVDPDQVDPVAHADYLIERVMSYGTWRAMWWLRNQYSGEVLASFVDRRGTRLPPRELAYWALITGQDVEQRTRSDEQPWSEDDGVD